MLDVQQLVQRVQGYQPAADTDLIRKAYHYSEWAHREQMRKSGDPYFIHPASVAEIITQLRLDTASVCAGLLHDVVEDTGATRDDIAREFGDEVAHLVDGVTKLGKINFTSKEDRQAESFRKMVVAMAQDIRVLLVKLCDRLDNMRTLQHMSAEGQERIARETLEIYAPLANRLGIQLLKSELEDLSFQFLDPESYRDIMHKLSKTKKERERYIEGVCRTISSRLAEHGFGAEVTGRAKHIYSIHRKMKSMQSDFEQVYDILAFRVCVESIADCYAVLGVMHSKWTPVPGRFKDYIALPKPNMYQSLHTAVIGPGRQRIEIQIRTHDMNRVAEHGVAAHWKYKERNSGGVDPNAAEKFGWLRELAEYQRHLKDPAEFLESVKIDLFPDEIYVFTPKGDVRMFPRNSTPIDFAYSIHTEVGNRCSGARANGAIVPLRYKMRNGDVIEVMTSPQQHPSKDWLDYTVTTRARNRVRTFLRSEQREKSINLGRELLDSAMREAGMSLTRLQKNEDEMRRLWEAHRTGSWDELLLTIGYGKLETEDVVRSLRSKQPEGTTEPPPELKTGRIEQLVRKVTGKDVGGIRVSGVDDVLVRYAKCCNPLPGDTIIGFITRGRGVTIHRRECVKAFDTDPERRIDVSWDTKAKINRPVQLKVTTTNKPGILANVSQTFSAQKINISEANCRAQDDGRACNVFTFHVGDLTQLKNVMKALTKVQGVVDVERV
ncbi:MAG: bifunctional (p)ppGpp synthetase/guanosine-3',5'-bis(diphosphate) 3'-pyrophosphohydrolase [Polyangiaceae bacterium]|nr:bifunctional (p)ppGpp synthetase/guanosine-3',5'-bis(diphosphate) 3'-pyrophosphohydrolase [Polyangiaceae bacterium]MCE7893469.1 bifunctional (p)ppGpp synthetase/guanosine-3',5'-bis(diphosphate) 3'-pyrophosphohydrolase [Sorangiineae bacterium PRO1]MCL4755639.1 bifunctional (p)ppGpp synthetase/guanosine-3',5'-bis(diphosphate) 3'-pyrophosphohydrolase [Myxococcales bacterium]